MRPDESCQTARLETWNFDVVTREETHSTYHETLSLHDVYKRENVGEVYIPSKKCLIDIYIMFATFYTTGSNVENMLCSPCQLPWLVGWFTRGEIEKKSITRLMEQNHCHESKI
jgi:hypothetical protein